MCSKLFISTIYSVCLLGCAAADTTDTLTPQSPVELTGTQGKFDFIKIDAFNHRLLACHTGNGSLDIIELKTSKLVKSVPTGNAQGVVVDEVGQRYFVSASKPPQLVTIDRNTMQVVRTVSLPGPADLVAYHAATNRVFVCNDEKPELWIIDPGAGKIVSTLTLPGGGMEDLGFSADGQYLFQCLKDTSELARIEASTGKFVTKWPTAPADKPHGLAMIPETDRVLIVGGNGKLVLMSLTDGNVLASCDVSPRIDEIAYDPATQRAYGASGLGVISVIQVDKDKLSALPSINSAPGAHSIAVDAQTHSVWIVFAKDNKSFVEKFTAK